MFILVVVVEFRGIEEDGGRIGVRGGEREEVGEKEK